MFGAAAAAAWTPTASVAATTMSWAARTRLIRVGRLSTVLFLRKARQA
jgi:hypothetical protein